MSKSNDFIVDELNLIRGLNLIFFFTFAFENEHWFEKKMHSLCKVLILCDFLNLACLGKHKPQFRFSY